MNNIPKKRVPSIELKNMQIDPTLLDKYRYAMEDLDISDIIIGVWQISINNDPRATFVLKDSQLGNSVVEEDCWDVFKQEVEKAFAVQSPEDTLKKNCRK